MWTTTDALPKDPDLELDSRRTLELLEEQILQQGPGCPQELLDAYDAIRKMVASR